MSKVVYIKRNTRVSGAEGEYATGILKGRKRCESDGVYAVHKLS